MSVNVLSGVCYIPGTEGTTQGMYNLVNNGTLNVAIAAANPTNPRIDLIVAKVQDSAYSGGVDTGSIVAVTGTPAGSPSPPAAPANSLVLAQISVPANDTTITTGQITDQRHWLTAPGGIIICTSTTRPATATIATHQFIWEADTQKLLVWNGSSWIAVGYGGMASAQARDDTSRTTSSSSFTSTLSPANILGLSFAAPPSGVVVVDWSADQSVSGSFSSVALAVKTGTTIGSGTSVITAGFEVSLMYYSGGGRAGSSYRVSGLTPGASYNAYLEHMSQSGTITTRWRTIMVTPMIV
jgi:hypothetical protein